jgi:hypothetical protein
MTASTTTLTLEALQNGKIPGISAARGECHVQACVVRFEAHGHVPGVSLAMGGDVAGTRAALSWTTAVDDQMRRTWDDPQEALEHAAAGIAILTLLSSTPYTVVYRSCKGTGVDYWLGEKDDDILFQRKARLEVSGIEKAGKGNTVASRVAIKKKQTAQSDATKLPAYVGIVELSQPHSHLEKV